MYMSKKLIVTPAITKPTPYAPATEGDTESEPKTSPNCPPSHWHPSMIRPNWAMPKPTTIFVTQSDIWPRFVLNSNVVTRAPSPEVVRPPVPSSASLGIPKRNPATQPTPTLAKATKNAAAISFSSPQNAIKVNKRAKAPYPSPPHTNAFEKRSRSDTEGLVEVPLTGGAPGLVVTGESPGLGSPVVLSTAFPPSTSPYDPRHYRHGIRIFSANQGQVARPPVENLRMTARSALGVPIDHEVARRRRSTRQLVLALASKHGREEVTLTANVEPNGRARSHRTAIVFDKWSKSSVTRAWFEFYSPSCGGGSLVAVAESASIGLNGTDGAHEDHRG